jgi:hypothetical protein
MTTPAAANAVNLLHETRDRHHHHPSHSRFEWRRGDPAHHHHSLARNERRTPGTPPTHVLSDEGVFLGASRVTCTHTRPTCTHSPAQVCKPVTNPSGKTHILSNVYTWIGFTLTTLQYVIWYHYIISFRFFWNYIYLTWFGSWFKHLWTENWTICELNHWFSSQFSKFAWTGQLVQFTVHQKWSKNRTKPNLGSTKYHWRHATFLPKGESRENAKITVKILLLE